jgi:hypothetical protein
MTDEQKAALRALIVAKAEYHLGEREIGFTNTGPQVDQFLGYVGLDPGYAWCMAFACYVVGNSATESGFDISDTTLIKTASCSVQANHARDLGVLVGSMDVMSGATVINAGDVMLVWEGGDYHHSGIVELPPTAASGWMFSTIEGNTNQDGGSEGYEVARQRRNATAAADGHSLYAFITVV